MIKSQVATLILISAAMNLATAQPSQPSQHFATITVDTSKAEAPIDPSLYGQFAEHKGTLIYDGIWVGSGSKIPNIRGIRNDVTAALRRIHVPVVRWPGGCFADAYHWRDGIGPPELRPRRQNVYGQIETNRFGTHEFMDFVSQIGAEPYISVNIGSGTVQEAAEWLEYMTARHGSLATLRKQNGRPEPWKVRYIGVGNEMWQCGGNMRSDYYVDNIRRYSQFLAHDDSNPRYLIASGPLNDDYDWTRELAKNASFTYPHSEIRVQFFEGVALHAYTFPEGQFVPTPNMGRATGFSEREWQSTLQGARRMNEFLTKHASILDEFDAEGRLALVVDEWGAWYAPESEPKANLQQNSLRDALIAASTFNIFHRHTDRLRMANISMIVNVFQAMILTQNDKMIVTPTYHVFDLYQPFQGATPYPVAVSTTTYKFESAELPAVDASAAKGTDGKTYLALVNVDPHRPANVATNLSGTARGRVITGERMDSHNTFSEPNSVRPALFSGTQDPQGMLRFVLPPKSVAVVRIE